MANDNLSKASLSIANVSGISNTINSNPSNITSLSSGNADSFTSNITNTVSSAVGDPVGGVLNKILGKIANVGNLAEKKVDDLTIQLESFQDKNSSVQLVNNTIVITTTHQNEQKAELEKDKIDTQISSIKNTLTVLKSTINTLQSVTSTINILKSLLQIQEALLTINPISKASFTLFKKAIKIVFLKDMLNKYSTLISTQLANSQLQLSQLVSRFMNLQVKINVQDNANQGISTDPIQALDNISQQSLGQDITNQSDVFISFNGKKYILKVDKYGTGQLIGKAIEQITGLLAVQTAPSYISSPDQLTEELKTILNS